MDDINRYTNTPFNCRRNFQDEWACEVTLEFLAKKAEE